MDVLPTPPFPPTKMTGVVSTPSSPLGRSLFSLTMEAISSIKGFKEYIAVDDRVDLECIGEDLIAVAVNGSDGIDG